MLAMSIFQWWYTRGCKLFVDRIIDSLEGSLDYFSMGLLLKTLFSPFRQISATQVNGPIAVQFRAFLDKLFSRIIGAFVRTIILIVGAFFITLHAVFGIAALIVWLVLPLLPLFGLFMTLLRVTF